MKDRAVGLKLDRGYVLVDNMFRTNVAGISAIGDVITMGNRPHQQLARRMCKREWSLDPAHCTINDLRVSEPLIDRSAQFVGTLYAPQAALTMSGSAAAIGALVANKITTSGGMSFHYDEALGGGGSKYVVTSWAEL